MTLFLSVRNVIDIHDSELPCPVIDRLKLESAVAQPFSSWNGELLYPTLIEQAAALLYCLCQAHAFFDGNKRAAWLCCVTFLDLNGVQLIEIDYQEVVDFVESVAIGPSSIESVAEWLIGHI